MSNISCCIKCNDGREINLGDEFYAPVAFDMHKNVVILKRGLAYNHAELAEYRVRKLTVIEISVRWSGCGNSQRSPAPVHVLLLSVNMSDIPSQKCEHTIKIHADYYLNSLFASEVEAKDFLNERMGREIQISEIARIADTNPAMLDDPEIIDKITDGNMTFGEYRAKLAEYQRQLPRDAVDADDWRAYSDSWKNAVRKLEDGLTAICSELLGGDHIDRFIRNGSTPDWEGLVKMAVERAAIYRFIRND